LKRSRRTRNRLHEPTAIVGGNAGNAVLPPASPAVKAATTEQNDDDYDD
jgi:hypothetical protein